MIYKYIAESIRHMATGTSFELETIRNYDFVIIAPEDDWVKKHW